MSITYEQAFRDHQKLWSIGPADDMTGGYVDQDDLDKLLAKPTKATARDCLVSQINYWFEVGVEAGSGKSSGDTKAVEAAIENDPEVREIAERYGYA